MRLTENQIGVLHCLLKRGAILTAAATERHWRNGKRYYLDSRNRAAKGIRRKFEQGNRDVTWGLR